MSSRLISPTAPASEGGVARIWKAVHRQFVRRHICEPHVCYPPDTGTSWREVPSADALFHDAYLCPECGQCFRPVHTAPATDLT